MTLGQNSSHVTAIISSDPPRAVTFPGYTKEQYLMEIFGMEWADLGQCLQRAIDNGGGGGSPEGAYQPWDHLGQPGTTKSHRVLKML